jgi:hypothetical protein
VIVSKRSSGIPARTCTPARASRGRTLRIDEHEGASAEFDARREHFTLFRLEFASRVPSDRQAADLLPDETTCGKGPRSRRSRRRRREAEGRKWSFVPTSSPSGPTTDQCGCMPAVTGHSPQGHSDHGRNRTPTIRSCVDVLRTGHTKFNLPGTDRRSDTPLAARSHDVDHPVRTSRTSIGLRVIPRRAPRRNGAGFSSASHSSRLKSPRNPAIMSAYFPLASVRWSRGDCGSPGAYRIRPVVRRAVAIPPERQQL